MYFAVCSSCYMFNENISSYFLVKNYVLICQLRTKNLTYERQPFICSPHIYSRLNRTPNKNYNKPNVYLVALAIFFSF